MGAHVVATRPVYLGSWPSQSQNFLFRLFSGTCKFSKIGVVLKSFYLLWGGLGWSFGGTRPPIGIHVVATRPM